MKQLILQAIEDFYADNSNIFAFIIAELDNAGIDQVIDGIKSHARYQGFMCVELNALLNNEPISFN